MSIETVILQKARTILEEIPWVQKVNSEKLLLDISQARDHETPLIQVVSGGKFFTPVQRRHQVDWTLIITAAMKSDSDDVINNEILEARERDVVLKIGENTQFNTGISNSPIVQWQIQNTDPIIQFAEPFQIIAVTTTITYEAPFSGPC